jgi:hypothetical protein
MPGVEKLPPEFMEAMVQAAPIFPRTEGRPLTPLPLEISSGTVRVFV